MGDLPPLKTGDVVYVGKQRVVVESWTDLIDPIAGNERVVVIVWFDNEERLNRRIVSEHRIQRSE